MKVTTDILNLRSEASTNSSIVTKLKKDDELKVIEETKMTMVLLGLRLILMVK